MRPASFLLTFLSLLFVNSTVAQEVTIHAQSNVVLIPVLVKDAQGHAIYGLQAQDFIVEDDGAAQAVRLDEAAEAQPISLVIAVQRGRQAYREFPRIRGLSSMIQSVLDQEGTLAAVVEFDSGIELSQEFTGEQRRVENTLKTLESGDGGAAILDAVKYSLNLLDQQAAGRQRVLLLVGETRDHGSHVAKIDDVVTAIGETNTTVYTLAFSPALSNVLDTGRGNNKDEMNAGPDLLAPLILIRQAMKKNVPKAISSMTGGEYALFDSQNGFETRMLDFTNHLRSRYLLSFQPQDPHPGLHRLQVRLRNPIKGEILARESYWANGPAQ
ncbi:MAG: VWA domain-containing protein [Terriglobales bacterium]